MKLQDYLHYYLGCNMTHKNNLGASYILHFDVLQIAISHGDMPVLRRLNDMTELEAIRIGRLCFFDRDNGYPDSDFKARKVGISTETPSVYEVSISNDWYDEVIKIGFNTGNIWRCNGSRERLYNQPSVFHYLLTQHFDLFNLIDNGLAVDAKTLKGS